MDFSKVIESNRRKAIVLLVVIYLLVALCFLIPGALFSGGNTWAMLGIAILGSAFYIGTMTLLALPISRRALGGRHPNPNDAREVAFVRTVEELAIAAQLPMPGVLVVDAPDINAFAIGFNPRKAYIGVNRGALDKLTKPELEGIVSHEFGHLAGRDTLLKTLAISCLGAVDLLIKTLKATLKIALGIGAVGAAVGAASRDEDTSQTGWVMAVMGLMLALMALAMMVPIVIARWIAAVLFYNMSRRQELRADAYGVQFTRNPDGLVSALNKIRLEEAVHRSGLVSALHFSSHLAGEGMLSFLYATHPPVEKRITALLGRPVQYDAYGRLVGHQTTTHGLGTPAPIPGTTAQGRVVRCPGCKAVMQVQAPPVGATSVQVRCAACGRAGRVPWSAPGPVAVSVTQRIPTPAGTATVACPRCRTPQQVQRVPGHAAQLKCGACGMAGLLKAAA